MDSISWIDSRLVSTSKRPPELGDALLVVVQAGNFFTEHWLLLNISHFDVGSYADKFFRLYHASPTIPSVRNTHSQAAESPIFR